MRFTVYILGRITAMCFLTCAMCIIRLYIRKAFYQTTHTQGVTFEAMSIVTFD